MLELVFVILFGLVFVISGLISVTAKPYNKKRNPKVVAGIISTVGLVLALIALIIGSIVIIPNGNIAVMVRFQQTTGSQLDAGLHWKTIIDTPVVMSIQTQKYEVECEAASKDLQDVTSKIAVNYKMDRTKAGEIYRTIGVKYFEVVGQPAIQEVVKAVTSQYNAEDMILKREAVKTAISDALRQRLAERGIISEQVNITNFSFSPEFTAAIESKVSAAQSVLQAQNKLEQIKVEAEQAQAAAIGKANATIAEADGQAKAIQIVTEAQVSANDKINQSLTPEVLQYIFIDRMNKNVAVWLVPDNQSITIAPK